MCVELYYHPPFADDEVGMKILTFSKYGILPNKMTEKNLLLLGSILFMELWKKSVGAILTPALHWLLQISHIYFWFSCKLT